MKEPNLWKTENSKHVVTVIPESNNSMNNVLTQITEEKLGNLEGVAKMTKKNKHVDTTVTCGAVPSTENY